MHSGGDRVGQRFSRAAGVVVPLFSLRGTNDSGSGEILDLGPFIDWLERWHQRVIQLLPINETAPGETSPYNALSVFAIDPEYVATAQLPDVISNAPAQEWLRSTGVQRRMRRARESRRRQRRAVYAVKQRLLELAFAHFETHAPAARKRQFEDFCAGQAWWLDDYALFRALKERFDWHSWESWPNQLRQRDPDALRQAATALQPRMQFFRYVQWVAAEQWATARSHARARGVLLKGDLPFVCGRESADVWAHQDLFDLSSSAGAPPDAFSPSGQKWGLPLYDWCAMRRAGYEWWRQRVRHARTLYDAFRLDHLVGLYRTYAIPEREGGTAGFVPSDEAEQHRQGDELLRAILEEAGSALQVVAEDLGSVPAWVRASLTHLGIPGYRVFRWETRDGTYIDPRTYPHLSIATTGTHDTDTLVEWWDELPEKERAGALECLDYSASAASRRRGRAAVLQSLLRRLYEAGSVWTIVPIHDLFGWRERINTPATISRRNWTYRLPVAITELDGDAVIRDRMEDIRSMIDDTGRDTRTV